VNDGAHERREVYFRNIHSRYEGDFYF